MGLSSSQAVSALRHARVDRQHSIQQRYLRLIAHPKKAMPVVLRTEEERTQWLTVPNPDVEVIQARTLPTDALQVLPDVEAFEFFGGYLK
jgi:hypothetical protein